MRCRLTRGILASPAMSVLNASTWPRAIQLVEPVRSSTTLIDLDQPVITARTRGSACGLRRYTAGRVTAVRGAPMSSGLPGLIRQPMVTARSAAGTPLIFAAYLLAM